MTSVSSALRLPQSGRISAGTWERLAWAGWFLSFGLLSAVWPRDAGFDVMHYHLHNGWSALNGRLHHDLAPAEMHSFLNPAYNMVVWWLIERLPGPAVAFLLGLVQAAILPVLYGLTRRFVRQTGREIGVGLALWLAVLGFFCAPAWSSFASLRNDHLGALAFLVGLYLVLPPRGESRVPLRSLLAAAACVGLAAGLKLTNIIHVPAFAIFVLLLAPDWTERARRVGLCAVVGAMAFFASAGPWMWILWQEFGNPVFPNFGSLFPGLDEPIDASRDVRYLPGNLADALTLPLRAAFEGRFINELAVFDLRLAISYQSSLILVFLAVTRRNISRPVLALAISVLCLLAVWIGLFSIMRYAMAVWMLAPLLAYAAWTTAGLAWPSGRRGQAFGAAAGLVLLVSTSPEAVRRIGWTSPVEPYVSVDRPGQFDYKNALIFVAAEFPAAFTAMAFAEARLTHIDAQDWSAPFLASYRTRIEAAVAAHDGPLYLIHCLPKRIDSSNGQTLLNAYSPDMAVEDDGARYGLSVDPDQCVDLQTSFSTEFTTWRICPLQRR